MLRSLWTHVSQLKKIKVLQSSFQPSPSQTRHVWSKSDPTVWTRGWSDWGMAAMEWTLNVSTYIETHGLKLTTFQTSHLETIPKHPLIYKKCFESLRFFILKKRLLNKKNGGWNYNNNNNNHRCRETFLTWPAICNDVAQEVGRITWSWVRTRPDWKTDAF